LSLLVSTVPLDPLAHGVSVQKALGTATAAPSMPANRGPAWSGVRRRHALPTTPGTEDTQQHAHYHARMSSAAHSSVLSLEHS
jgi:hypothetical protein